METISSSLVCVGRDDQGQPGKHRQGGAEQDVALAAASEQREGVGEDAGEGLEVPGQSRPEEERGIGAAVTCSWFLSRFCSGSRARTWVCARVVASTPATIMIAA